jgi:hypothetical protein
MNKLQKILFAAAVSILAANAAVAGETKAPKAVGVAVPPEGSNAVSSVGNLAGGAGGGAAASSYAREASSGTGECTPAPAPAPETANNTGPGRISMNVTVPKQTQGATFGEKVNQGLHASGGSLGQAASQVGANVPGGAVISSRCAQVPAAPPMETPAPTDK